MRENGSSSQNVNHSFPLVITSLTASGRGGFFLLTFSDTSTLRLYKEIVAEELLHEGKSVSEKEYLRLKSKQENESAVRKGLDLLARRAHSEKELRQKLKIRGFSDTSITHTVDFFYHCGYLDDEDFCRQWISSRIRKSGYGRSRIIQELFQKGVSREIVNTMISELYPGEEEYKACLKYYEKIRQRFSQRSPFSEKTAAQKLAGRGFSYPVIRKVLQDTDT